MRTSTGSYGFVMSLCAAVLAAFTACAPPPLGSPSDSGGAPDGVPSIEIIYPDPALGPYCDNFLVVVAIRDFTLNDGFYEGDLPLVDGEGHWHLILPNSSVMALGVPYATVEGDFGAGTYSFTAQLVDNAHAPVPDTVLDVVEIPIDGDDPGCIGAVTTGADDSGDAG